MSLTRKMLLSSCLVLILTAMSLTGISTRSIREKTLEDLTSSTLNYSQSNAEMISNWLKSKHTVVAAARNALSNLTGREDIVAALHQAWESGNFSSTFAGNTNGDTYYFDGRQPENYDPRARPWYKLAQSQSGISQSEPFWGKSANAWVISFSQSVTFSNGLQGALGGAATLEDINRVVSAIDVPGDGIAFLVSETGTMISHPDSQFNGEPLDKFSRDIDIRDLTNAAKSNELAELTINDVEYLVSSFNVEDTDWYLVSMGQEQVLMRPIERLFWSQVLIALGFILAAIFGLTALIRYLLSDLLKVSEALEDIAQGDGDLTVQIDSKSNDEVGKLATNFNAFVLKLRGIISDVAGLTTDLSEQSNVAASSAEERSQRVKVQMDEITMVATAVTEMTAATQEIASNAELTAHNSKESVDVSEKGQQLSVQCQTSINSLASEVDSATQVIEALNQQSEHINSIVTAISDIAEQTNLLALNAAIEAARAGEQGRGFAVVADEVRVLSQRTHTSTEEISQMINQLQTTTNKAVKAMAQCHELASTSVTDTESSNQSFTEINGAIQNISDMSIQISTAAEEQASVTEEISRNTENIRTVSEEFREEALEGSKQANDLKVLSDALAEQVSKFKL